MDNHQGQTTFSCIPEIVVCPLFLCSDYFCDRPDGFNPNVSEVALEDFIVVFSEWLDLNRDHLECTGSGNLVELATLCAAWARRHPG